MWEQEISHHDCCLNVGLLDEQYISCSYAREMDLRIQYLFHATHVQAKKKKNPNLFLFIWKSLFSPLFMQYSILKFFSYDVTLTQLPESMKAAVFSASPTVTFSSAESMDLS